MLDYDRVSLGGMNEHQHRELTAVLDRVRTEYQARAVFLVESCGRPLARSGLDPDQDLDTLASLVASTIAAAQQLARALGEPGLTVALQRGCVDRLHLVVTGPAVLAVLLTDDPLAGLPRLRARLRRSRALKQIRAILEPRETPLARPLLATAAAAEIDAALEGLTPEPASA